MTAENFIEKKTRSVYSSDVYDLAEAYASHVLQEYKKELGEWVDNNQEPDDFDGYILNADELLTKLKEE